MSPDTSLTIPSAPILENVLPGSPESVVRPMGPPDFEEVVAINQGALEGVGPLDTSALADLVAEADEALVLDDAAAVAGFVITLPSGADYDSSRYRWFENRLDEYTYLDRIVVAPSHRRRGVASCLYDVIEGEHPIGLEVYETNDASLAFHTDRGYREIGQLEHAGKVNLMMLREPDAKAS